MEQGEIVVGPDSKTLEALEGEISEPIRTISHKPGFKGQQVTMRVAEKGPGMIGLRDTDDNREWSGIFNHSVKTAGASLTLGKLLRLNGQKVNEELLLNTVMLSHAGRRQYDEANWYPNAVADSEKKKQEGDTRIGLDILKEEGISEELVEMVSAHGLGLSYPYDRMDSWNKKLSMYLDFRISQGAMPMEQRFKDLRRGVENGRYTQEYLDKLHEWAKKTEVEFFDALHISSYADIVKNPDNFKARIDVALKLGKFTPEETKKIKAAKLYNASGAEEDVAQASGVGVKEFLKKLQLSPEDINDKLLKPELWERYIRRLYVNDAEDGIFERLSQLYKDIDAKKTGSAEELNKEFPENTWWGKYARELYDKRDGKPLHPRRHKQLGINRAIEFYHQLEQERQEKAKKLPKNQLKEHER